MHIIDILNSPQLIKRFCRDYNVPVATFAFPYFERQLDTLSIHDTSYRDAFMQFIEEVTKYQNAEDYFAYYNGIKESIINYISSNPQFVQFSNSTFAKGEYASKELYADSNHGKTFISIDMRKANFNIVKKHCPDLFGDVSWEEVVASFGGSPYLQKSKYIRQVIFGACNPKKQIQAQTEFMNRIASSIDSAGFKIYSVATDEVILENADIVSLLKFLRSTDFYDPRVLKVEQFCLKKIGGGYSKTVVCSPDSDCVGKTVFKCVDGDFYCQFIKYYYGKPIEDSDLIFDYKGTTAKFTTPIINPMYCTN